MDNTVIRHVNPDTDASAIANIYNYYVTYTTVSFETEPLTKEQMRVRIREISKTNPYLVAESNGKLVGFAYIHPWKERAAYCHTYENTIYLDHNNCGTGTGTRLMTSLINEIKSNYPNVTNLIACITEENHGSCSFHSRLGFKQVSHFRQVGAKLGRKLDVVDYQLFM